MSDKLVGYVRHPMAYAPLKLCIGYLSVTMFISFWGPIDYFDFPKIKTFVFMTYTMIAITVGYTIGARADIRLTSGASRKDLRFFETLFRVSLAISLLSIVASVIQGVASGSLNTDLSSMGDAYINGYSYLDSGGRNSGSYSLSFLIFTFTYPFSFFCFVMGLFYFDSVNKIERASFIFYVALYLLYYVVGSGKMKYLGDLMIYSLTVIAVRHGAKGRSLNWKVIASGAIASFVGVVALLAVLGERYAALGFDAANANVRSNQLIYFDLSHPIFKIFGEKTGLNIALLLSYVSQGYYGLGLGLQTDWQWTRFQGFSYSLSVLCNQFLGLEWVWPNTLVSQIGAQWGWDESKWHTVFVHFATDFTFPGTAVLFGLFAYAYARSWIKAIVFRSPPAILMFVMLSIGMFFMPANNQLLQAPSGLLLVIITSFIYFRYQRVFNTRTTPSLDQSPSRPPFSPQISV